MSGETNKKLIDKLLKSVAHGDNDAFSELYERTKKGVFSICYAYLKNYDDAEDVMQNVYLKIKLNISSYKVGTNGGAWILSIAKNLSINEYNKKKRLITTDQPVDSEYSDSHSFVITDIMAKTLSQEEQEIVTLHVLWKYKHKEIAKILNCPVGTITSKYKRALEKLKDSMKDFD